MMFLIVPWLSFRAGSPPDDHDDAEFFSAFGHRGWNGLLVPARPISVLTKPADKAFDDPALPL